LFENNVISNFINEHFVTYIIVFFSLVLLTFILNKFLKYRLGSTGGFTDPVYVITCNYVFKVTDLIEIRLGVKRPELPLAVDLKFAYLDSACICRIATVYGVEVEWDGNIGTVMVANISGGIYQNNFTCRAWITFAYFAEPSKTWVNLNSKKVEFSMRRWLLNRQKTIKKS
jgi:hypothetical protein